MDSRMKMKDMPAGERPYEKLELMGAEMLSNAELLAIIIKTGNRNETSVDLARRILKQDAGNEGIAFLYNMSLEQLKGLYGVGRVKAIQIKALMELSRRISSSRSGAGRPVVKSPDDICNLLMEEMRYLKKEVFKIVLLSTKNNILRQISVSVGSLNASIVHPREVFTEVVKCGCSSIILVHNHPSGDPEPSTEDVETTARLVHAGDILGIKVLDHVIIGDGRFISLKEKGLM
jgi:DNA repair protein RadC